MSIILLLEPMPTSIETVDVDIHHNCVFTLIRCEIPDVVKLIIDGHVEH